MNYKPNSNQPSTRRFPLPLRPNEAPNCRVYVIELHQNIIDDPKFLNANPNYRFGRPCVYVGMTSLTPEERFAEHTSQGKNSSAIAASGRRLRMDLVDYQKPIRRTFAFAREKRLANELRAKGYGVWQA